MTTRILTTDAQGVRDLRRLVTGARTVQRQRTGDQRPATRTRPIVVELIADIPADGQPYPVVQITDAGDRISRTVRNISTRVVTADDNGSARRVIADAIGSHGLCVESVSSSGTTSTSGGCCGDSGGGDLVLDDGTISSAAFEFGFLNFSVSTGSGDARIDVVVRDPGDPYVVDYDSGSDTWIVDIEDDLREYNSAGENVTVANDPQGSFTLDRSDSGKVTLTLAIDSTTVGVWSCDAKYWRHQMSMELNVETVANDVTNANCTICVVPVTGPSGCNSGIWAGRNYPVVRAAVPGISMDITDCGDVEVTDPNGAWSDYINPVTGPANYLNFLGPARLQKTTTICRANTYISSSETTNVSVYQPFPSAPADADITILQSLLASLIVSTNMTFAIRWDVQVLLEFVPYVANGLDSPPVPPEKYPRWFEGWVVWAITVAEPPSPGDVLTLTKLSETAFRHIAETERDSTINPNADHGAVAVTFSDYITVPSTAKLQILSY